MAKKLLGVDYGEARTGLAYSDALGLYAVGYGNVKGYNLEKCADEIVAAALKLGAETIVIGKPYNMNFTEGEKVEKVMELARLVGLRCDIPIDFYDERLTTVSAHQLLQNSGISGKKRRGVIDTVAAELILQGYMDRQKNISK